MKWSSSDAEASICIGCGLCCDGTLHGSANVYPEDEQVIRANGIKIIDSKGKRVFRQPCPKFGCGECTIYANRPSVCRTYRCRLLIDTEDGIVDERKARERVAKARELVRFITSVYPLALTPELRAELAKQLSLKLPQLRNQEHYRAAEVLLALNALDYLLGAHFRKRSLEP